MTDAPDTLDMMDHADAGGAVDDDASGARQPAGVPEKFWDPDTGAVRVDALVKSYRELERKMGAGEYRAPSDDAGIDGADADEFDDGEFPDDDDAAGDPPGDPAGDDPYEIVSDHPWLGSDPELNASLHAAGFSSEQAQLVYDLAQERVLPLVESLVQEIGSMRGRTALEAELGGPEAYEETAQQVRAWGEASLPPEVFDALAGSPNGVLALRQLMQSGEPKFVSGAAPSEGPDESGLRRLMDDPRYWRDHDPAVVRQVEDGFRRLYPET